MSSQSLDVLKHAVPNGVADVAMERDARGSAATGDRNDSMGDAPHQSMESVASLLRRFGIPPADWRDHLSDQFLSVCHQRTQRGDGLNEVDLNDWFVTEKGSLVLQRTETTDPSPPRPSGSTTADSSENQTTESELLAQFRELLKVYPTSKRRRAQAAETEESAPVAVRVQAKPIVIRRSTELSQRIDPASPWGSGRRGVGQRTASTSGATSGQTSAAEPASAPHDTADTQLDREQLLDLLILSLSQRFGPEAVQEAPVVEPKSRPVLSKPLERDRRFNWNLVLGIGTAVTVATMVLAGVLISNKRQNRRSDPIQQPQLDHAALAAVPQQDAESAEFDSSAIDLSLPDLSLPTEQAEVGSDSSEPEESDQILDQLDDLQMLLSGQPEDELPTQTAAETSGEAEPSGLSRADLPPGGIVYPEPDESDWLANRLPPRPEPPPQPSDAEKLEEMLGRSSADNAAKDAPQRIRPGKTKFIELPWPGRVDHPANLPDSVAAISSIEFPFPVPISLQPQPQQSLTQVVCHRNQTKTVIADLLTSGETKTFQWTEASKQESWAAQVVHGRLMDANGQPIYLRPAIDTDPFRLSLRREDSKPSWNLGYRLLKKDTHLDLDLSVPKGIEFVWETPFNPERPQQGRAIAILTRPDAPGVAVAVVIDIRCTNELKCQLQFAARLDPSMPWQTLQSGGIEVAVRQTSLQLQTARNTKPRLENAWKASELGDKHTFKRKLADCENQIEKASEMVQRLQILASLVRSIEAAVTIDMHLFVQWPEGRQTILQTAAAEPSPDNDSDKIGSSG
ncbi:hypothetical protein NHH03_21660 [Stieleria sp. TO1_6]|uniref:hypothetical protein n=1 Tax=Stieleria tagensis TaxID=2956795 RepID=UPI00209B704E|nr:hypothetical protein [Stieleria tagensis]MCO8124361.1 hypothetical protein [Stieleria tagensis]